MISRHTYKDLVWVDLESPTQEEVRQIMEEFCLHPIVASELLEPTLRAKVEPYEDYVYLILHFPTILHKHHGETEQEIDFIVGRNFLITTHYELVDPLHEFSKIFEVNSLLDKSNIGEHAGFLFFYLIRQMYHTVLGELDRIDIKLEEIEASIFDKHEVEMVQTISETNRDLLNFKQAIRHHKEVLESFEIAGRKLFGEDFIYYLRAILGEYYKIAAMLEGHKETLLDLRDTNDSLLTTHTNEIMKFLTIVAFITFPLALIASIFGMNTSLPSFVGQENDFWIVMGIMATATLSMFIFFRYKHWM